MNNIALGKCSGRVCRFGLLLLMWVATVALRPLNAQAQPHQWTVDERVPGYLDDTYTPLMIADPYGAVHVFANQWVGEEDRQLAIVYRQWTVENGWTDPIDVLLAPSGDAAVLGAYLDGTDTIHLAYWGGKPASAAIYYASAPASLAWQAPAWSTPQMVGTSPAFPATGALLGDDQGNLAIIYGGTDEGNGIYVTYSADAGTNWSEPYAAYLTYHPDLTPYSIDAIVGHDGLVHVAWNIVSATGTDTAAYYARFDITGQVWTEPFLLEERIEEPGYFGPSFPRIVDTGERLVVLYNSGNPAKASPVEAGRPIMRMRTSEDGGVRWTEAVSPFARQLGRSGEHALVVDSEQVVHTIFMQRIEERTSDGYAVTDGPWHGELYGTQWREPQRFPTQVSPHDMRAVICQGNILLVAWREDPGTGESGVWFSYTLLDVPEQRLVPLPTVTPRPIGTPPEVATPTPTVASPAISVFSSSPTPPGMGPIEQGDVSNPAGDPADLLVVAAIPVVLVMAMAILFQRRLARGGR